MSKYTDRIKELRKEKKLTQAQLAIELGLSSPSRLRMWESGASEPSIDMLVQIAKYFQVSVDYLISRTNRRNDIYMFNEEMSPQTTNAYKSFIEKLNIEVKSWETHPFISAGRTSAYLDVLCHDLSILRWVATKPTESTKKEYDIENKKNFRKYKIPRSPALHILYPKQRIELLCNEHNNKLQELLIDNYMGLWDDSENHPELYRHGLVGRNLKEVPYGNR